MTEKSNIQADAHNRYTFEVDRRANKVQIADAVARVFSVNVVDVRVMNVRGKRRWPAHGLDPRLEKGRGHPGAGESIPFFEGV